MPTGVHLGCGGRSQAAIKDRLLNGLPTRIVVLIVVSKSSTVQIIMPIPLNVVLLSLRHEPLQQRLGPGKLVLHLGQVRPGQRRARGLLVRAHTRELAAETADGDCPVAFGLPAAAFPAGLVCCARAAGQGVGVGHRSATTGLSAHSGDRDRISWILEAWDPVGLGGELELELGREMD